MYKKYKKKTTALLLALCMMLGLSTGCEKRKPLIEITTEEVVEVSTGTDVAKPDDTQEPVDNSSVWAEIDGEECPYTMPDPDSAEAKEEQKKFDEYLWDSFEESVTNDTVTLHYTIADPESYGITPPEIPTFGDDDISEEQIEKDKQETIEDKEELEAFNYDLLTGKQKYTYDVLMNVIDLNIESYDFTYMYEPFAYTSGVQTNMPINMSEYKFYRESDVTDYLALLNEFPDFFQIYLDFESEKAKRGLFMNEHSASEVVRQCQEFIAEPEDNLLIATFEDKVRGVEGLSEEQIQDYITQNHDAVMNSVIPAYKSVITFFEKHKRVGKNELGLAHLENGKEYYRYLLADKVGTDKTPEEVIECLDAALEEAMSELQSAVMMNYGAYASFFDESDTFYEGHDPKDTIDYFKEEFSDSFPEMPDVNYTVENVHPSLEDIVSPAFYVTTPIDAYRENSIYLNMGSDGAGNLWSTLAHEGIPGHMYQFTYYLNTQPEPLRALLNFTGYQEGWATYVEMMSYAKFHDYKEDVYEDIERINSELNLLVSARVEIGVNYEGWDKDDTAEYLTNQGFNGEAAQDIMDYVIAEPVNYQMYVMGWQSFEELRAKAELALGDKFDEKEFHKVLLEAGPSQFFLVEKLVDQYIRDNK